MNGLEKNPNFREQESHALQSMGANFQRPYQPTTSNPHSPTWHQSERLARPLARGHSHHPTLCRYECELSKRTRLFFQREDVECRVEVAFPRRVLIAEQAPVSSEARLAASDHEYVNWPLNGAIHLHIRAQLRLKRTTGRSNINNVYYIIIRITYLLQTV